jgi:hypothetical protein
MQLAVLYIPAMNALFGTVPLGPREWAAVLSFCVLLFAIVEIIKGKIDK